MMITESFGRGKTTLLDKITSRADGIMMKSPSMIILYHHMQEAYNNIQ